MCENKRCWIGDFDISLNLIFFHCQKIADEGVSNLKSLVALRDLNLARCVNITGASLRQLTSLTKLNLFHCDDISDVGMSDLKSLAALRDLNLAHCVNMTGVGLKHLTCLTKLDLSHCEACVEEKTLSMLGLVDVSALDVPISKGQV